MPVSSILTVSLSFVLSDFLPVVLLPLSFASSRFAPCRNDGQKPYSQWNNNMVLLKVNAKYKQECPKCPKPFYKDVVSPSLNFLKKDRQVKYREAPPTENLLGGTGGLLHPPLVLMEMKHPIKVISMQ